MLFTPVEFTLKNGKVVTLRTADESDAAEVVERLRQTAGETHFMGRYPDEINISTEAEVTYIQNTAKHPENVFAVAVCDGKIVGTTGYCHPTANFKTSHRAILGISVIKDYWGCGIGTFMMNAMRDLAKASGLAQLELGVFADNERAIALYRKCGYTEWGRTPRAFRLRTGEYIDEIQMYLKFK